MEKEKQKVENVSVFFDTEGLILGAEYITADNKEEDRLIGLVLKGQINYSKDCVLLMAHHLFEMLHSEYVKELANYSERYNYICGVGHFTCNECQYMSTKNDIDYYIFEGSYDDIILEVEHG